MFAEEIMLPSADLFIWIRQTTLVQIIGVEGVVLSTIVTLLFIAFPREGGVLLRHVFHVGYSAFVARFLCYTPVTILACFAAYHVCELLPEVGLAVFLIKGVVSAAVAGVIFAVLSLPPPEFRGAILFCRKALQRVTKK